jgi:hypothetical protein
MVIYRVIERGPERFIVESFTVDHGAWRCIDEFPTMKEANARLARLEKILRVSRGEPT